MDWKSLSVREFCIPIGQHELQVNEVDTEHNSYVARVAVCNGFGQGGWSDASIATKLIATNLLSESPWFDFQTEDRDCSFAEQHREQHLTSTQRSLQTIALPLSLICGEWLKGGKTDQPIVVRSNGEAIFRNTSGAHSCFIAPKAQQLQMNGWELERRVSDASEQLWWSKELRTVVPKLSTEEWNELCTLLRCGGVTMNMFTGEIGANLEWQQFDHAGNGGTFGRASAHLAANERNEQVLKDLARAIRLLGVRCELIAHTAGRPVDLDVGRQRWPSPERITVRSRFQGSKPDRLTERFLDLLRDWHFPEPLDFVHVEPEAQPLSGELELVVHIESSVYAHDAETIHDGLRSHLADFHYAWDGKSLELRVSTQARAHNEQIERLARCVHDFAFPDRRHRQTGAWPDGTGGQGSWAEGCIQLTERMAGTVHQELASRGIAHLLVDASTRPATKAVGFFGWNRHAIQLRIALDETCREWGASIKNWVRWQRPAVAAPETPCQREDSRLSVQKESVLVELPVDVNFARGASIVVETSGRQLPEEQFRSNSGLASLQHADTGGAIDSSSSNEGSRHEAASGNSIGAKESNTTTSSTLLDGSCPSSSEMLGLSANSLHVTLDGAQPALRKRAQSGVVRLTS